MFSSLYNDLDGDPRWLELATPIAELLIDRGRTQDGDWFFSLHADGTPDKPPQSIYVDGFCIYGLTEYAKATGNSEALEVALESFMKVSPQLDDHANLRTQPHPIPMGYQAHGPLMLFALVFHDLGYLSGNQGILGRALELAERVMTQHLKPEDRRLYEFVRPGGELDDSDVGKTIVPGHVIESMWFMARIYSHHGFSGRLELAMETIRWHLELGWDVDFGGIRLACHTDKGNAAWHMPDAKIWWPHTESLLALLQVYEITHAEWALDWYWKVHEYTFTHFPNQEHGEWFHNLNRDGTPMRPYLKDLPVKDPFHLPRALIYSILILKRLAERDEKGSKFV
jgi:N-acylglucosamine 2-epimerase